MTNDFNAMYKQNCWTRQPWKSRVFPDINSYNVLLQIPIVNSCSITKAQFPRSRTPLHNCLNIKAFTQIHKPCMDKC